MIRFSCICGNRLGAEDEQGGGALQCPLCGLLTDIPTLSQLSSFTDEGTYRIDADRPIATDPDRMAELGIIYSKEKRDSEGNEIDLRTLPAGRRLAEDDDVEEVGELDFAPREPEVANRPKYDPETGELIRPLEVQKDARRDVNPASIPVAKAAINYASANLNTRINPLNVAVELLMPMNVVVMCFVFAAHFVNAVVFVAAVGLLFVWPVALGLQGLLLSHYGNVIDDTGRNDHDDLPRPLRNLDFYDDLWSPFVGMFGGFMLAYGIPAILLINAGNRVGVPTWLTVLASGIIGSFLAPAILLTTNTSGSTFNLRPDRVLSVIRLCGVQYFGVVLLGAVTGVVYLTGWLGTLAALLNSFFGAGASVTNFVADALDVPRDPFRLVFANWLIVLPALLIGIYLMHWFCWFLGLLYKAHHDEFPWVLQRFIRDSKKNRRNQADHIGKRRRPSPGHLLPPAPPPPPPSGTRPSKAPRTG